jgi:hypothetical protein
MTSLAPDLVREIEDRANVIPLGDLHERRRKLLDTLAPLKALHGHNGIWDDKRKQFLETMKVRARMDMAEKGVKATDQTVEAAGYADPQYAALIDQGITDRIEYIKLANELTEIEELIRDRELGLAVYNSELRLGR